MEKILLIDFLKSGDFDNLSWAMGRYYIFDRYGITPNTFLSRRIPSFIKYDNVLFYFGNGTRGSLDGIGIDFVNPACATYDLIVDYGFLTPNLTIELASNELLKLNILYKIVDNKIITQGGVNLFFDATLKHIYRLRNLEEEKYFSSLDKIKLFKQIK